MKTVVPIPAKARNVLWVVTCFGVVPHIWVNFYDHTTGQFEFPFWALLLLFSIVKAIHYSSKPTTKEKAIQMLSINKTTIFYIVCFVILNAWSFNPAVYENSKDPVQSLALGWMLLVFDVTAITCLFLSVKRRRYLSS